MLRGYLVDIVAISNRFWERAGTGAKQQQINGRGNPGVSESDGQMGHHPPGGVFLEIPCCRRACVMLQPSICVALSHQPSVPSSAYETEGSGVYERVGRSTCQRMIKGEWNPAARGGEAPAPPLTSYGTSHGTSTCSLKLAQYDNTGGRPPLDQTPRRPVVPAFGPFDG